jgi:hypothetical protein
LKEIKKDRWTDRQRGKSVGGKDRVSKKMERKGERRKRERNRANGFK